MTLERDAVQRLLERTVGEESPLLAELEARLQAERAALQQDDVDSLEPIGRARQRCVQELSRLDAERSDACRRLALGGGRNGLARLFTWVDPSGVLERRWLANLDIARRCRDINDENGAIVTARLAYVRQMLGAIRGSQPPPVYGATGIRHAGIAPRELGSA